MTLSRFDDFSGFTVDHRIAIYGTGETGRMVFSELARQRPDLRPVCFFDSFKEGELLGLEIRRFLPELVQKLEIETILVGSAFWKSILDNVGSHCPVAEPSDLFFHQTCPLRKLGDFFFTESELAEAERRADRVAARLSDAAEQDLYRALFQLRVKSGGRGNQAFFESFEPGRDQYLDFIDHARNHTIIEAGVFDGSDTIRILDRAPADAFILGLEPVIENLTKGRNAGFFAQTKKAKVLPLALGDEEGTLKFSNEGSASFATAEADSGQVRLARLDDIVREQKLGTVDFIKMDIEGAEMHALRGAAKTIASYRPQMAVSIYHHRNHLFEIPELLMELLPDSEFHLGHYTSSFIDSVIYVRPG